MMLHTSSPLTFVYKAETITFSAEGDTSGRLCITCAHPVFTGRFNGGTKCFDDFNAAPFLPDLSDANYLFFFDMRETIESRNAE